MSVNLEKGNISILKAIGLAGAVAVAVWAFVQTVVLPINNIQLAVVEIQATLKTQGDNYAALSNRVSALENKR